MESFRRKVTVTIYDKLQSETFITFFVSHSHDYLKNENIGVLKLNISLPAIGLLVSCHQQRTLWFLLKPWHPNMKHTFIGPK